MINPLIEEGERELLPRYTPEQVELIIGFLNRVRDLQERHVQRLRTLADRQQARAADTNTR